MTKIHNIKTKVIKENERTLRIKNKLPQIILPENKVDMFVEWWNEDIRFLKEVPHTFNSGYLQLSNNFIRYDPISHSKFISTIAKVNAMTYREVETKFIQYIESTQKITMYFEFVQNDLNCKIYDIKGNLFSVCNAVIGTPDMIENTEEEKVESHINLLNVKDFENVQNEFNRFCMNMLICSFWYMATTRTNVKYYYERTNTDVLDEDKRIVKVKKHKLVNTPIYDFNKIYKTEVKHLISHRQGWTYSHSFQVHGHYRRYKDGKVIFINSYIKGKNKPFRQQTITLLPESNLTEENIDKV